MPVNPRSSIIFIVEDDPDVCDSVEAVLSASGHHCVVFPSAEAMLESGHKSGCDCLVIDVDLPRMDGIELLTTLRNLGDSTPALFYTGRTTERLQSAVRFLGNVAILRKGDDADQILHCLISLIKLDI